MSAFTGTQLRPVSGIQTAGEGLSCLQVQKGRASQPVLKDLDMQELAGASMYRQVSPTSFPSPASTALCPSVTRTPCSEVGRPCWAASCTMSSCVDCGGCSTSARCSTLIDCHHTGKQGETRKKGKAVPKKGGSYVEDYKPKQAGIFSNARNAPREKGFGGGGPWQKIDPKTPGEKHWNGFVLDSATADILLDGACNAACCCTVQQSTEHAGCPSLWQHGCGS